MSDALLPPWRAKALQCALQRATLIFAFLHQALLKVECGVGLKTKTKKLLRIKIIAVAL